MDVDLGIIKRTKKSQALDMIHVKMSKKDVNTGSVRGDPFTKVADSGARVEHEHCIAVVADLDRRCIAPISSHRGSGCSYRSAGAK
jgi:hypothetical protein